MQVKLLSAEQQVVLIQFREIIQKHQIIFDELKKAVKKTKEILEGNIWYDHHTWNEYKDKTKPHNLFLLSQESTNMLEIGFNAGHSSLVALLANPTLQVTAVDIGQHKYVKPCYEILQKYFPNRLRLILGDSTKALPNLLKQSNERYDLIHIDGGHNSIVANADIYNAIKLSAPLTYIVLDDTQKSHLSKLWQFYTHSANLLVPKLNIFPVPVRYATTHAIGVVNVERIAFVHAAYKDQLNQLKKQHKKKKQRLEVRFGFR
jgi:hypothetical protein